MTRIARLFSPMLVVLLFASCTSTHSPTAANRPGLPVPRQAQTSTPSSIRTTTPASRSAPTTGTVQPRAASKTEIKVYGNCQTPSFEPTEIILACADHGEEIVDIHW